MKKNLSILGSTGSIGGNALKIVAMFPQHFAVKALAAKRNVTRLAQQIERFRPELAAVGDEDSARDLRNLLPKGTGVEILFGAEGYRAVAVHGAVDMLLNAVVGAAGLTPTLAAIEVGKHIALANKETLVMAGEIVMKQAAAKGVQLLPVDSEHSAIFQCLSGQRRQDLSKVLLTASGGPFLNRAPATFGAITREDALKHPNWQMGAKITIDSATLMNKGLEVIEAQWLFGVSPDMIEVVIHPQSIIHSMVAYQDGSIIAQLGIPDMKAAIAYALSYPERLPLQQPLPDFTGLKALAFQPPDLEKFPCLALAFQACQVGGTLPAVLNAANEVAVNGFLEQRLAFTDIPTVVKRTMQTHTVVSSPSLADILAADQWARTQAGRFMAGARNGCAPVFQRSANNEQEITKSK
ncbi:MAG: 1-deoxy-D-xylulose-5-phosphate reductoisomerase [Desulfobacterales bacterium]|nr:MAG: 1-deoxy-D-xylulose-5-phosphate reductoisomerase [Desulfobacterales bacterium]